mmetsp:Transcript_37821/g.55702  ORF Transcript_37821/g.55702 Transcript_37821/m.55702 type:complete len:144 (+) Transcript_37821:107-538(+)|eukprot:CAMPEP_0195512686 /NCGR_PEP_ID=MMETSP0794_2-20130614/4566_1 /TAXON_ID=515487 /ORGANISM="Stephanopyxis turris, Strain CCMP 815" /LENGTH=143 /DNA_ID=CAMNT_0040640533 /DNA_START=107 /DNA_END=538 /DNA_ORIENTATION=+
MALTEEQQERMRVKALEMRRRRSTDIAKAAVTADSNVPIVGTKHRSKKSSSSTATKGKNRSKHNVSIERCNNAIQGIINVVAVTEVKNNEAWKLASRMLKALGETKGFKEVTNNDSAAKDLFRSLEYHGIIDGNENVEFKMHV